MFSHPRDEHIHFELLMKFKRVFVKGGNERKKFSIPSLIFALLKLSREMTYRSQGVPIPFYGIHVEELHEEKKDSDEPEMVVPKTDQ